MGITLDIHLPNKDCFPYLLKRLKKIHYYISYLEISADYLYLSEETVIKKARVAAKKINVKYINRYKLSIGDSSPDERFFTNKIYYWGAPPKKMIFAIYTPYSKPLLPQKVPCIHTEWRLTSSKTVWKYAKVTSLEDLADFDFEQFFKNQFQRSYLRIY